MHGLERDAASDELQELLAARPSWLVRNGILSVAAALGALLALTGLLSYPDVLHGRVVITAARPPVAIMARASGRLAHLYVKEGDAVAAGALVGVIENPAHADDVLALSRWLRALDLSALVETGADAARPPLLTRLGELQAPYSTFVRGLQELRHLRTTDHRPRMAAGIREQLRDQERLGERLERQYELALQRAELLKAQYRRQELLAQEGLVPAAELTQAELAFLESRGAAEEVAGRLSAARSQRLDHRNRLLSLEREMSEVDLDGGAEAAESYKQLLSQLAAWEDRYALRTPIAGKVSLGPFWTGHQFVGADSEVLSVVPAAGAPVGRVTLPLAGAGKARRGQRVLVKLDDYAYQEFGMVEGTVDALSPISREGRYVVTVRFPERLITSHGTAIPARAELSGAAEIVTDDVRLIHRLLRPLRAATTGGVPQRLEEVGQHAQAIPAVGGVVIAELPLLR